MMPQHVPHPQPLQVALSNVHLFEAPPVAGEAPNLLRMVADVTGIPPMALALAEHRMAATGSLAPLRELLANPAVPKADGLRYQLTVKQLHQGAPGRAAAREELAQRLSLALASGRGQVNVDLTVILSRRPGQHQGAERQSARIAICYRIASAKHSHTYRHEMTIAGDRPRVVFDAQVA